MNITHSNDGVEIPEEGIDFEVVLSETEPPTVITLHDVLFGLNLKPSARSTSGQSQAELFARLALMRGFRTEEDITSKYGFAAPRVNDNGEVSCASYRLIRRWSEEIEADRNRAAADRMRSDGALMSPGQVELALNLSDQLIENNFGDLANRLLVLIQSDEATVGPKGGDLSDAIGQANRLLRMRNPRSAPGPATTPTSEEVPPSPDEEPF